MQGIGEHLSKRGPLIVKGKWQFGRLEGLVYPRWLITGLPSIRPTRLIETSISCPVSMETCRGKQTKGTNDEYFRISCSPGKREGRKRWGWWWLVMGAGSLPLWPRNNKANGTCSRLSPLHRDCPGNSANSAMTAHPWWVTIFGEVSWQAQNGMRGPQNGIRP